LRLFHHNAPEWSAGVARINDPGPIAVEDVERRLEDVAHHAVEVRSPLDRPVDAVHRLQEPQVRLVLPLGALALGDVAADAPVAHEAPDLVERRDAGYGDVARATVRSRPGELEIAEGKVRVERGAVLAPGLFVGLDV